MELDGLATSLIGVCRSVDVLPVVLTGLAGEEFGAALVLEHPGVVDGETRRRGGSLVALELGGWCYICISLRSQAWGIMEGTHE